MHASMPIVCAAVAFVSLLTAGAPVDGVAGDRRAAVEWHDGAAVTPDEAGGACAPVRRGACGGAAASGTVVHEAGGRRGVWPALLVALKFVAVGMLALGAFLTRLWALERER